MKFCHEKSERHFACLGIVFHRDGSLAVKRRAWQAARHTCSLGDALFLVFVALVVAALGASRRTWRSVQ